jgi:sugar (pentulose or hexulose) kinase
MSYEQKVYQMLKEVIAVFDIGKTNKKFLLFDASLKLIHQDEQKFSEIKDEEGFSCDDIAKIETWMKDCVSDVIEKGSYNIAAVNFTTYGASLMYIDAAGQALTPVYNYLKPMPADVLEGFYESYGGLEEFSRKTASPSLGMLNSGLQALWLKRKKPEVYRKVDTVLHFPQYLASRFTGGKESEFTSIGCHTAMWDFDNHCYHPWMLEEKIPVPQPVSNSTTTDVEIGTKHVKIGIGIHDSSASLVPYIKGTKEEFILISTGTWCIFMNPFNTEPLTMDQLRKDCLCYMSVNQQQVKSSRLFLGHIHDVNVERLNAHFGADASLYKKIKPEPKIVSGILASPARVFFKNAIPADYIDATVDLGKFSTFEEAYHQMVHDMVSLAMESLDLIISANDKTKVVYVSGGFARSELFVRFLATRLPGRKIYTSEVDNATALGAAMVVWESAFGGKMPLTDLSLSACLPF